MTEPPTPEMAPASAAAYRALLGEIATLEDRVVRGPLALADEQYATEAYRWVFSILAVALDCYVWADPARPRFVDIVGPNRKWGGDNADAYYQFAPIDPTRAYRVRGRRGDSVYLSLTVYGGPDDGRYSERIVGSVNDEDLVFDADGGFECWIGPQAQPGPGVLTTPDAVCVITRDYLADAATGRRAGFDIEALEPAGPYRSTDADLARGLAAARVWVREQADLVPIDLGEPNRVDPPYPVPTETFGWAAGDAAYAMGSYDLGADEALVLTGRSPACRFWNLCLWNPLLHSYQYLATDPDDSPRVSINGTQVTVEADGSWRIVVAGRDPGHPNWVATQGHRSGLLWFRWFLPAHTPEPITAEVLPIAAVVE